MKNRGTPDFNKFSRGPPKEHPQKFEANPCSSLREEIKKWDIT